ncbi:30S ribosomal protein S13 [Candidatus Vidania fulgoroideorum]
MILNGVSLIKNKYCYISITYIFGIGISTSIRICKYLNIQTKKISDLTSEEKNRLQFEINKLSTEGELKKKLYSNIRNLIEIKSYRGERHKKFLPTRGQRTRTNAKTRKKYKKFFFIKNDKN